MSSFFICLTASMTRFTISDIASVNLNCGPPFSSMNS
jgi:hypothetical protein